jgi:transposase-like protein
LKRRGVARQNGYRRGKQSYRGKNCGTQYVAHPCSEAYSSQIKQTCIEMYLNGMGIRGISRVTKISHPTIVNWIKEAQRRIVRRM